MLKGLGRLRITVFISLMGLVIVPVVVILAVFQSWHNPYIAVTVGLATGNIVYGVLQTIFGSKAVHAGFRTLFTRAYVQPLLVAALVSALAFGVTTSAGIESLLGRTLVSFSSVLLFFIACYLFIASVSERQQIRELTQLALNRLAAMRDRPASRT
jgi:hypothetical protein